MAKRKGIVKRIIMIRGNDIMQTEITFRNIDHSLAIEKIIHKKIHKLQQTANNIIACHAIIEKTKTNRKEQISIFSLTIKVDIPGKTVVVSGKQNQDIYVLIRDSFKGILRKLEAYRDNQNLKTKLYRTDFGKGRILRLYGDEEGYGFIKGNKGTEYYFNNDSLVNIDFKQLKEGTLVHFVKTQGREGPCAMRISITKKSA